MMWISSRKRILLWHTARNILAIFYLLQTGVIWCCDRLDPKFDNVESKSLLSEIVVSARIISLSQTRFTSRRNYRSYTATVRINYVLKQSTNLSTIIERKDVIDIDGFMPNPEIEPTAQSTRASSLGLLQQDNPHCLSYVSLDKNYILFLNHSSYNVSNSVSSSRRRILPSHRYHTAQLSTEYTQSLQKKIRKVLCDSDNHGSPCARAPNAKSKRNLDISEGAYNYKISCRAEGNPPPDVRWYKDNRELDNSMRGIAVKHREKGKQQIAILRIKSVSLEHAGTYKCVATNVLGEDIAKTRLRVTPGSIAPKPTPTPPGSDIWDSESLSIDSSEESEEDGPSHYIPCLAKDRGYCLHGGQCQMLTDGRYKHCRCKTRFTGTRCEEAKLPEFPPTAPPKEPIRQTPGVDLVVVVTALAVLLAVMVILMLILAFYLAGWRHRRHEVKRINRQERSSSPYNPESAHLLDETDSSKPKTGSLPTAKQVNTVATQTEPGETSLQQIRRSLNLENYFPHSSSDVVLRRKGSNASHLGRPASQPLDRRPTRSRLSATSTITENKRRAEDGGEFNALSEQVPSSTSLQPDAASNDNSRSDAPQANCDQDSIATSCSLYISESSTSSSLSETDEPVTADKKRRPCETNGFIRHHKPSLISSYNAATTTANNNSEQFTPRQYNGN